MRVLTTICWLGVLSALRSILAEVVVLTSTDFEHKTQASTGATTGDWFVEFYAPWCGHCKHLEPIWDSVAEALEGEVNVAKVDVPANRDLGQRFDIRGYPSLRFFRQGQIYAYSGKRDKDSLVAFARGGYKAVEGVPVPGPPSFLSEVKKGVQVIQKEMTDIWAGKKKPEPLQIMALIGGLAIVVLTLLALVAILTGGSQQQAPSKDKEK